MKLSKRQQKQRLKVKKDNELLAIKWSLDKWASIKGLLENEKHVDKKYDIHAPCGYCNIYSHCGECPIDYECDDFLVEFSQVYEFTEDDSEERRVGLLDVVNKIIKFLEVRRDDLNG